MRADCVGAGGHDDNVVAESELLAAVDVAFAVTGRGLTPWPDPHPDRSPLDEEYSRLLDPAKWRIIGARAEAWLVALVDSALAVVERVLRRSAGWSSQARSGLRAPTVSSRPRPRGAAADRRPQPARRRRRCRCDAGGGRPGHLRGVVPSVRMRRLRQRLAVRTRRPRPPHSQHRHRNLPETEQRRCR